MCSVSYSRPRWIPSPRRRPRSIPSPRRRPRWIPSPRLGVQQRIRKDLPQARVVSNTLSQVQHRPSDAKAGVPPRRAPAPRLPLKQAWMTLLEVTSTTALKLTTLDLTPQAPPKSGRHVWRRTIDAHNKNKNAGSMRDPTMYRR